MDTLDTLQKIGIGATGVVGSNLSASVIETVNVPVTDWTSAIVQVVIAIATIFSLFKKKGGS